MAVYVISEHKGPREDETLRSYRRLIRDFDDDRRARNREAPRPT